MVCDTKLDKDIKITLIATGFDTSTLNGNKINEAEINAYVEELKTESEDQMDMPAFLRRAQHLQHHTTTPTPAPMPQKQQTPKAPSYTTWNR